MPLFVRVFVFGYGVAFVVADELQFERRPGMVAVTRKSSRRVFFRLQAHERSIISYRDEGIRQIVLQCGGISVFHGSRYFGCRGVDDLGEAVDAVSVPYIAVNGFPGR